MSATKKCPQCAEEVKGGAKICRHCGHKFSSLNRDIKVIACVAALATVAALFADMRSVKEPPVAEPQITQEDRDRGLKAIAAAEALKIPEWSYSRSSDEMRRTTTTFARNSSLNKVDLDFPYAGGTTATIVLRRQSQDGLKILLAVDRGQFVCGTSGCHVTIGFDCAPPKKYSADEPADYSSKTLFLAPEAALLSKLRTAKKTIIEVGFYQSGQRQFAFNTSDLHWPPNEADLKP